MNNTRVPNRPAVDGLALHDLARRASFLWERLAAPTSSLTAADRRDDTAVRQRIQRWSARLRPLNLPDDEAISKRLAWDGLDAAVVSSCLADDCDSPYDRLPNWAHTMAAISEGARAWHASGGAARSPVSGGLPFEPLFEPIRLLGRQRLAERLARSGRAMLHDRMSAACAEQFERALMSRLAATSAKALMHEFSSGLPLGEQLLRRLAAPAPNAGSTHFQRFVDSMLQDGFATLFNRYPVLARLMATLLDGWVETTACLVERLTADYSLLQETFSSPSVSLGQVATLQLALSDAHRGGSSTVVLGFDSGIRLLYKPKSLALDVAYNRLLQWCND